MLKRLFRPAVLVSALVVGRRVLQHWVDGPDPQPLPPRPAQPPVEPSPAPIPVWVKPEADGRIPASHPVKVKLGSKLYRGPESPGYDKCQPDRCYVSVEAAKAAGFTEAKR